MGSNGNSTVGSAAAMHRNTAARETARNPRRVFATHEKANSGYLKGNGKDPGQSTQPEQLIPFDDGELSDF